MKKKMKIQKTAEEENLPKCTFSKYYLQRGEWRIEKVKVK